MKKIKINENLTIEIPSELNTYNNGYTLKITNQANQDVEIKLYLKPLTTENIVESWYQIEPEKLIVPGRHQATVVLTITKPPKQSQSTNEEVEVVTLFATSPGKKETVLSAYNLIIPPATQENPAISLVDVGLRLTQLETLLNQKQDLGEIQALQTEIEQLKLENASLTKKVIEHQENISQLEQTHKTQIETLKTALQEEKTKVNRLLEVEEKKRHLTEDLGNGITLELVEIPAGKFLMGGFREITLSGFLMGKYPVTQLQWFAIMGNNPSSFEGNHLPVEQVSWQEAKLFCEKLSALTGRKYQLPSESQWEYACRADTITNFFFGNDEKEFDKYAWYYKNSNNQTHRVGEKLPNPWGLYDILGNVWEWCQDDFQEGHSHIPLNGHSWITNSTTKGIRGSAWYHDTLSGRSGSRNCSSATVGTNANGLRVVMLPGAL